MATKLVAGCGYLGLRVARRWLAAGHTVYAMTRRAERASDLAQLGVRPIVADVTRPESLVQLPEVETLLMAIGLDRQSGHTVRQVYVEGLEELLRRLPDTWQRLLYISSTGVYGQQQGEWVDEGSPTEPTSDGGRACLEAEQRLEARHSWERTIILRMAGLYGPGRIPRLSEVSAEGRVQARLEGWVNLIHVDDAAEIVVQAEKTLRPPERLVVSDGHPALRRDYLTWLARQRGIPSVDWQESDPGSRTSRGGSSKRVSNRRMQQQLNVRLQYPTYREGLAQAVLVEGEGGQR